MEGSFILLVDHLLIDRGKWEKNRYITTHVLKKSPCIFIKYIYMRKSLESALAYQIVHNG